MLVSTQSPPHLVRPARKQQHLILSRYGRAWQCESATQRSGLRASPLLPSTRTVLEPGTRWCLTWATVLVVLAVVLAVLARRRHCQPQHQQRKCQLPHGGQATRCSCEEASKGM